MDLSKSLADKLFPMHEEETQILDIPPNERQLHTETYDFTVSTLVDNLNENDIKIPEFQRKFVWTRTQASRLIESLIIQCPIPVIYLSQQNDETLLVIDGNQRLSSLQLFLDDDFELRGLEVYPELEGFKYSDLDSRIQRHINKRTIRCIIIQKNSHPQIKFDVFQRLNTGSIKLNDQELRHGVFYGDLIKFIEDLSKKSRWQELTCTKSNKRMKAEELILRFFSLYDNLKNYKKPFVTFINDYVEKYRSPDKNWIDEHKESFLNMLEISHDLMGNFAFKLFDENLNVQSRFNNAIFDAESVALARLNLTSQRIQNVDKDVFQKKLGKFISSEDFYQLVATGTSGTSSVKKRIMLMEEFILKQI
jgi:uncharacterized protein with ParB-like and HNH nuclease domain